MISLPSTETLMPRKLTLDNGVPLYVLQSDSIDMVRLDLQVEAGTLYQPRLLTARAATNLWAVASKQHSSSQVSEYFDYRGIILNHYLDNQTHTSTIYMLRKYVDEVIPMLAELRHEPAFPQEEFDAYAARRKQILQTVRLKSDECARHLFYKTLLGAEHPLATWASPNDVDQLQLDEVRRFYAERHLHSDSLAIIASGKVDEKVVSLLNQHFGQTPLKHTESKQIDFTSRPTEHRPAMPLEQSVQTTVRVGRILPLHWDTDEYARLMILTTTLGGYFGSRLMSNLREQRGYTYGAYAHTRLFRDGIAFFATANVAGGTADASLQEIEHELTTICDTPLSDDELRMVKTVLVGDFVRSVDGIFERAERLSSQLSTHVDERLTERLRQALADATPSTLLDTANRYLRPDQMVFCRAGAD